VAECSLISGRVLGASSQKPGFDLILVIKVAEFGRRRQRWRLDEKSVRIVNQR